MADHTRSGSENSDEAFESQLNEILDSGPDIRPSKPVTSPRPSSLFLGSRVENRNKPVLEIVIRVIAAFAVLALLIGFALRVAYN